MKSYLILAIQTWEFQEFSLAKNDTAGIDCHSLQLHTMTQISHSLSRVTNGYIIFLQGK